MTTCPSTPAFMSPEACDEPPVYTEKLDNFSFGVLLVQITTRQKPTDQFEIRQLLDPRFQNRVIRAKVPVPELERRQAHIDLIPPAHPLLLTALHCLKDNDGERPTAAQLCQTLTALKRTARYQETSQQDLHQLPREKDTQLLANQEQLRANKNTIAQNNEQLLAKNMELATRLDQATQDNHTLRHEVGARERQLRTLHQELQSNEENCAALQQTIQQRDREVSELRQELASKNEQVLSRLMLM